MRRPTAAERRAERLAKAIAAKEGLAVEVVWHDVWNARRGRTERKRTVAVVGEGGFVTGFSSGACGYLSWGALVRDYTDREGISSEEELELRFAAEGTEEARAESALGPGLRRGRAGRVKAADKARLGERLLAYFRASGREVQAVSLSFSHGERLRSALRRPGLRVYRLSVPFKPGRLQEREGIFVRDGLFNANWTDLMRDAVGRYCKVFRSDEFATASSTEELDLKLSPMWF